MSIVPQVPNVSFGGSGAGAVVQSHFATTTEYAATSFQITQDYLNTLSDLLQDLEVPDTGAIDVTNPNVPDIDYTTRPSFGDADIPDNFPTLIPIPPVFSDLPVLPPIDMPVMTFEPPVWGNPEKPESIEIATPGESPDITLPDIPTAPAITLPSAPVLDEILMPAPPVITIPPFDGELPSEVLTVPEGFSWEESPYNSEVWVDLLGNVLDGLRNGGTGLDPQVEQDIWERARARQQAENEKVMQDIRDTYSNIGYQLPPGSLAAAEMEATQEISRNDSNLSNEIAIKQAELAKEHGQFITTTGLSIEQVLRGFHDSQANRSLEAAKTVAASSIEIFNAYVTRYNSELDRYKSETIAYEARVKAALVEVDIFKTRVESAKVQSDVQANLIDIYSKQVDALMVHVQLYNTQMESVKVAAEIESIKLELFRSEVQAYVARLEGEKVKFDVYMTEVESEKVKAETYSAQVRSFVAEVEAKSTEADVDIKRLDSVIQSNNALVSQYLGELKGYSAEISAASKQVDAAVEGYKADVSGYNAETQALGMMYATKVKEIDARIEEARFKLLKAVSEVDAATKGYVAIKELEVKGTEGIMNVGAQLTSAAMNAVNTSASLGTSYGESFNKRLSHSMDLSESHRFDETE